MTDKKKNEEVGDEEEYDYENDFLYDSFYDDKKIDERKKNNKFWRENLESKN